MFVFKKQQHLGSLKSGFQLEKKFKNVRTEMTSNLLMKIKKKNLYTSGKYRKREEEKLPGMGYKQRGHQQSIGKPWLRRIELTAMLLGPWPPLITTQIISGDHLQTPLLWPCNYLDMSNPCFVTESNPSVQCNSTSLEKGERERVKTGEAEMCNSA